MFTPNYFRFAVFLTLLMRFGWAEVRANAAPSAVYVKRENWAQTLLASRAALADLRANEENAQRKMLRGLEADYPMQWDWMLQDAAANPEVWFEKNTMQEALPKMIRGVLQELGAQGEGIKARLDQLSGQSVSADDLQWLTLYENACESRRALRLKQLPQDARRIVFTKHYNLGGSHYAYTEGQSDAQAERHFLPGSELCLLEIDGEQANIRTLLKDAAGVIRDPAVSYDGKRILFAWKKSDREDDYHLYEMEVESGKTRQLTSGLGVADYEGTYLPNGDILFNSTRCVQIVDCWWTEVSNLYTCDKDGRFLRRTTFDQVHDNYPTVMNDGRVIYTRWEYNDRGQIFPQPLFQMNPDGTGQTEYYGNNSWFPTSILHARGIPGSQKAMAILSGHHCMQAGKLALIDPSKGRQEAAGVQLIAPVRETKAERIDSYGQDGELFQYPWPLSEEACLVACHPLGWGKKGQRFKEPHFKIYLMMNDGRRELLAADPALSCNQPAALAARPVPFQRSSTVDYRKAAGTFSMQNIYAGKALPGVKKGSVKRLRVVALDFRAAGVKHNGNGGPAGGAMVSTPVAIDNGSWDPKIVLGDATVYEDGSAFFQAPARTPLYFMALDEKGCAVQSMRSWSTLQPAENASCIGCHEDKNAPALAVRSVTQAMREGAQPLMPFYGPARPFSFTTEIQPILNRHCIRCHDDRSAVPLPHGKKAAQAPAVCTPGQAAPASAVSGSNTAAPTTHPSPFSLLGEAISDEPAGRQWSDAYLSLTHAGAMTPRVNWIGTQSIPPMLPPYFAGAARSSLIAMLEKGHKDVKLSREELEKIACWIDLLVPFCGDYREAAAWSAPEHQKYDQYLQKRRCLQETERAQIAAYVTAQSGEEPPIRIERLDAAGQPTATPRANLSGDRLQIVGPCRMMIRLSPLLPECLVASSEGRVDFPLPLTPQEARAYPPAAFAGENAAWTARPATSADLHAYRNLALNPYDPRGSSTFFPHATSNSECRNDPAFAARTAIDGSVVNTKHGGWPNQSWGPDQRTDLWWKVDFGRMVEVDKVVLWIRADFPHDTAWSSATLRFSDGATQKIDLRKTAQAQTFPFAKRTVSWVQLENFVQDTPLGWCALSEVEVWGCEATLPPLSPPQQEKK